jgi:hypothetical protein
MLSLLLSSRSRSDTADLRPVADCDLDSRRDTELDLVPRRETLGEHERPWLVCALSPFDMDGLQETIDFRVVSFMLFARVETTGTSCSISIELLEAYLSAAGRDDWDLTDDGMFSSRVDGGELSVGRHPWSDRCSQEGQCSTYLTGGSCR